jgi:hypothetical protein
MAGVRDHGRKAPAVTQNEDIATENQKADVLCLKFLFHSVLVLATTPASGE